MTSPSLEISPRASQVATSDGLIDLTARWPNSGSMWLRRTDSYRSRADAPILRSPIHWRARSPNFSLPAYLAMYSPRSASPSIFLA